MCRWMIDIIFLHHSFGLPHKWMLENYAKMVFFWSETVPQWLDRYLNPANVRWLIIIFLHEYIILRPLIYSIFLVWMIQPFSFFIKSVLFSPIPRIVSGENTPGKTRWNKMNLVSLRVKRNPSKSGNFEPPMSWCLRAGLVGHHGAAS